MINITSEFDYNKVELNETRNIVENTQVENEQKYCANYRRSIKVKCVAEFLDKMKKRNKNYNH